MYGKAETLELLDREGIAYELYEHVAVYTVAEAVAAGQGCLAPGAVTPLGALNDTERRVEVVLDQALVDAGRLTVHPCDNTATVLLATADLIALLHWHGHDVCVVDL